MFTHYKIIKLPQVEKLFIQDSYI